VLNEGPSILTLHGKARFWRRRFLQIRAFWACFRFEIGKAFYRRPKAPALRNTAKIKQWRRKPKKKSQARKRHATKVPKINKRTHSPGALKGRFESWETSCPPLHHLRTGKASRSNGGKTARRHAQTAEIETLQSSSGSVGGRRSLRK
jgi:hypothetical protein